MFGTNAPRLVRAITDEIEKTKKAIEENLPREGIGYDELTDEEQEVANEEKRRRDEANRVEEEAREQAVYNRRVEIVENMVHHIKEFTIVILYPKCNYDQQTSTAEYINEFNIKRKLYFRIYLAIELQS